METLAHRPSNGSHSVAHDSTIEERIPVLIVGGGGCGLTSSSMLSSLGIEHVLVEAHRGTSILPKAHVLNQRSAEILAQFDILDKITATSCPPEHMKYFHFKTSFAGTGLHDNVTLARPSCFGCDAQDPDHEKYRSASKHLATNLPLIRLEPILRSEAEKRNSGKILFNHRAVRFQENADNVSVDVLDQVTGAQKRYIADYVIAADGGKTFPPALGVEYAGPQNVANVTTVAFKADLSAHWQDGDLMCWLFGLRDQSKPLPKVSIFGADLSTLVQMGPTWGKHCEEFSLHMHLGDDSAPLEELVGDRVKEAVRDILRIPDLQMEVLSVSRWNIQCIVASQYQTERIFLAGDAVHRHPPTTGLGLNTAIGDTHNLTWKLAAVLKAQASPSLLKSYGLERRPIGQRNAQWALFTFMNLRVVDVAMGLFAGPGPLQALNPMVYGQLLDNTFDGAARRKAFAHAALSQRVEFKAQDLEMGGVYATGALLHDGSEVLVPDPSGQTYIQNARPGHRLPHVWLRGKHAQFSTHDFLDNKGTWVLFTDTSRAGTAVKEKIEATKKNIKVPIKVVQVGQVGDVDEDEDGKWWQLAGLVKGQGGMVLVRPDAYVALRCAQGSNEAIDLLGSSVNELLNAIST